MSEREKIIALARGCNIQSLKEPRYHMDIYELTGQAIEAFYHKAQCEILEQAAKVCESHIRPTMVGVFDREDAAYTNAAKAIRQLIKE